MSLVTEILTYDQLHDLWGAGFTIVRRNPDPFEIDPKLIPAGVGYQWNEIDPERMLGEARADGWNPVPYSRHEGVFAPWGTPGVIQRRGLELCERPKVEVDKVLEQARTKALQNVEDWATKNAALGITGSVTVGTQTKLGELDNVTSMDVGKLNQSADVEIDGEMAQVGATKTIETIVAIPRSMTPYIAEIFKERDRLEAEVVRTDRTLAPGPIADKFHEAIAANERDKTPFQWWPTLRAILLPIAVDNVARTLKKEPTDE